MSAGPRIGWPTTRSPRPDDRCVNDVHASFRFRDGLIAEHTDRFDFHRWSRQALGTSGLLLGWTPLLRSAVRRRARAGLDEFLAEEKAGAARDAARDRPGAVCARAA